MGGIVRARCYCAELLLMYCMLGSPEQRVAQRLLHALFIRTKSCIVKKTSSMLLRRAATHVLHARFIRTKSCPAAIPCSVYTNKKLHCEEDGLGAIAQSCYSCTACSVHRNKELHSGYFANLNAHACKPICSQTNLPANTRACKPTCLQTYFFSKTPSPPPPPPRIAIACYMRRSSATNAALEQSSWRRPVEQET